MPYTPPADTPPVEELSLPADANDLDIGNIVIHKAARPYVDEWYNDVKEPGDTPAKFLLRMIYQFSLTHRANKLRASNRGPGPVNQDGSPVALDNHHDQAEDYRRYIDGEEVSLKNQIEAVLP